MGVNTEDLNGKADVDRNPDGTAEYIKRQREKERHGHFVRVPIAKTTYIFVRDGEKEDERINAYINKINGNFKKLIR